MGSEGSSERGQPVEGADGDHPPPLLRFTRPVGFR